MRRAVISTKSALAGAFAGAFAGAPALLLFGAAFFFVAAFFASRFPDVPGSSVGSFLSTLVMAAPSFAALLVYLGVRRGVFVLAALGVFGYAVETTGVLTGLPYGEFFYGDALGGKLFGVVPYLLPASYAPLVLGALAACWRPGVSRVVLVFVSALLLTLMDGVLDPGAAALGFWAWPEGGPYYGVPVSNFLGWLLSGALAAWLLVALGGWERAPEPGLLDGALLGLSFWVGVSVFAGMWVPASLGVALLAYLFIRRSSLGVRRDKLHPTA